MPIELRHLRYFIAVAEELHFSRAAERLGMSQPPLSQQIRQLEAILDARLLTRTNRRVTLTEAGRLFLAEARDILQRVDHAVDLAQRGARGEAGELRIGFTASTPLTATIPDTVFAFRQALPQVHLQLEEMTTLQQIDALLQAHLHIGIIRRTPLPEPLVADTLFEDPLVVVMRHDHALLQRRRKRVLTLEALADEPFVMFSRGSGTGIRDQILALCRGAGFSPRISQEARESSTIIGLVAAGLGVSLLPASYAHVSVEGVAYVPLADPGATSQVQVVRRRDERSPLVARFVHLLLETRTPTGSRIKNVP